MQVANVASQSSMSYTMLTGKFIARIRVAVSGLPPVIAPVTKNVGVIVYGPNVVCALPRAQVVPFSLAAVAVNSS